MLAKAEGTDIFAANRARGTVALAVVASDGVTRRARVREAGSLRVRFPNTPNGLEAVIVNTGGGMTGGDAFTIGLEVGEGARLVAGTAAAEKIYRSTGANAAMNVRLAVGAGARLAWLPQETILFDAARLKRSIEIDMAETGSLLLAEAVVFGRTAMGEAVRKGGWRDRWRVRIGGRLVFAENVRLDGAIADKLQHTAVAGGARAIATLLLAPADESVASALRGIEFAGEAGASAWNGITVVRFCARDGGVLRHDLMAALAVLRQPVPRLWLQ